MTKQFMLRVLSVVVVAAFPLAAQQRHIDFRYSPEYSFTPIGFVDDWQKTMVNDHGALLYDFGPGPYVRPNTIVGIGVKNGELTTSRQRLDDAHVPIVLTDLSGSGVRMALESFAIVPRASQTSKEPAGLPDVKRSLGLNGALAWANPQGRVDPAFRNVAWGTNRPIVYDIGIERGSRKKIALGFCESYRTIPGLRMAEVHIEGSQPQTIDLLAHAARNQPQVVFFNGSDKNEDGNLHVEIRPSVACRDPNVILNALWVFPPEANVTEDQVIAGNANQQADVYLDCGKEPQLQRLPTRIDAVHASIKGTKTVPVIRIRTHRICVFDAKTGVLMFDGRPFVASKPKAVSAVQTSDGWELELPPGTRQVDLIAINGYRLPKGIASVPDLKKERLRSVDWWSKEHRYPHGRIVVPDKNLQFLLDAGMRTLYQLRDEIDGARQYAPGSTVYRGVWTHDELYTVEMILMQGDTASAREAVEALFPFQEPSGKVKVMWPADMQRETPLFISMITRYARLTNDREWLRRQWHRVVSAMDYVEACRKSTMTDPSSLFYGLLPAGFTDGGVNGLAPDYSSVYWGLIAARQAIDGARWLGETSKAEEWTAFRNDLLKSFRTTAAKDMRTDPYGNHYLPVKVADTTRDVPQRGQWVLCEAVNLGSFLADNDPLVVGTLAVLDSSCVQGLPVSFGWLTGGIGVWFAPMVGLAHFEQGDVRRAQDMLYAFANHATPLGAWAEEQMPKGEGPRTTGDFPTNSAYVSMLKLVVAFLVDDHGSSLRLLRGVPPEWLRPGCVTEANDILTKFGRVSATVTISADGTKGSIRIHSTSYSDLDDAMAQYTDATANQQIVLEAFREAGFHAADGSELPDVIQNRWGHDLVIDLKK